MTVPTGGTKVTIDVSAIVARVRGWLTSRKPVLSFVAGQRPVTVEQRHVSWIAVALVVLLVVVSLGGGRSNSPTGTVSEVFRLVEAGQYDKVPDLACDAYKAQAANSFNFASSLGSLVPGLTSQQVASAIHITTSDLSVTEESRTGNVAKVRVKGTMKIAVDADKYKEIIKSVLGASGQTVTDSQVTSIVSQLTGAASTSRSLDSTVNVVNEGGSWKICQ